MSEQATAVAPVQTRRGLRPDYWAGRALVYFLVAFFAFLYTMPFVWMISTSVKPGYEIFVIPPKWIPSTFEWSNYTTPWNNLPFVRFYQNTAIITLVSIAGTLLSASLVAFAFARMRFRGREFLFLLVLATMMLPGQVTLIPTYVLWTRLGAINTYWPLILPSFFGGAFNIFLLRQYMMTIPIEMDDAARIDGASWFQIYARVVMPLAAPALGVIAIFSFNGHWTEYLGPLIYLNDYNLFTISLGLQMLNSRYSTAIQQTMAQTIISIVPVLIVFFVFQRHYIQGIVISGVKG
jgi:ABC-type glycerol-3-phosphate transport system permease component